MIIRAYLRASTRDQDANRAREQLKTFALEQEARVTTYYVENASGASIERVELQRLLSEAGEGDILLVEAIDRLSRLPQPMWESLKRQISQAGLQVVSVDLPVTYFLMKPSGTGIEPWLQKAMAQMLIEFMAAFARKDYEDRRTRQAQGIATAKAAGRLQPRKPNLKLYAKIIETRKTLSIRKTAELHSCSKGTVARAETWARETQQAEGVSV
ncbi:recombinase family protein [Pseudomonas protegens]|uniref:recombinase family protein n=1 Tax=Pseudomonas protegens TaxID=380021 RepID=UPI0023ECF4CA|nr:recombinase family protein [Pseudomonas protegens]MDF4211140.1 recombinase family protein [Pseudomonas protegens]